MTTLDMKYFEAPYPEGATFFVRARGQGIALYWILRHNQWEMYDPLNVIWRELTFEQLDPSEQAAAAQLQLLLEDAV